MKLALRYIPTEVWVDVFIFPWISRRKLSKIVHGFKNRKFIEILQYCLHERGKRTLDWIWLDKEEIIPLTPLPDNIKYFDRIIISHFDSSAIDFIRRISTLFIANDVNLFFGSYGSEDLPKLRTIFDHLAPLFHGIHSMSFDQSAIPIIEQYFAPKLAQIQMLTLEIDSQIPQAGINFVLNWLNSDERRDHAEPRLIKVYTHSNIFQQISTAVQQQYHSARRPCTFAIRLIHYGFGNNDPIADFHLENNLGEQLHGQSNGFGRFQIHRHQPNGGTALQEWVEETVGKSYKSSVIELPFSLTIGEIAASAGAIDEVNDAGAEEDGP